ncbi:unnamed protein product [Phaeothamnion confervicola]
MANRRRRCGKAPLAQCEYALESKNDDPHNGVAATAMRQRRKRWRPQPRLLLMLTSGVGRAAGRIATPNRLVPESAAAHRLRDGSDGGAADGMAGLDDMVYHPLGVSSAATWPMAETCSFRSLDALQPNATLESAPPWQPICFPRAGRHPGRTYAGMLMWTSRGDFGIRRAVLAMLGDEYAYYESPLFTAYKLLALGRIHELSARIFPSLGDDGWMQGNVTYGYDEFWQAVTRLAFDLSPAISPAVTSPTVTSAVVAAFPRAASEAEAVALAKALVDNLFDLPAEELLKRFYRGGEQLEDSYFALFSSYAYRSARWIYGRDEASWPPAPSGVLVLAPAATARGLDLDYLKLAELFGAKTVGETAETAADRVGEAAARLAAEIVEGADSGGGRAEADASAVAAAVAAGWRHWWRRSTMTCAFAGTKTSLSC